MPTMPLIGTDVNVSGYLESMRSLAENSIQGADDILASLDEFVAPTMPNPVEFSVVSPVIHPVADKPDAPSLNSTGYNPSPYLSSLSHPSVTIGPTPVFTGALPVISFGAAPEPLNITIPTKDYTLNLASNLPDAPSTIIPPIPTLESLNIPTTPSITLPAFLATAPSASIAVPIATFSFSEAAYSDTLLTAVKNELLVRLQGGTGLNPIVEQAIWNRGSDRELRASRLSERTLLNDRASQGFQRPPGALQAALDNIVQESQSKIIELSREIMIKQADLEQENIKHAIQQTIALEDMLIRENANISQRAFEVAKYTQEVALQIFQLAVSKLNADIEVYKAYISTHNTLIQAELAKLEVYKSQIESEKLKGAINEVTLRAYQSKIEAIKAGADIYRSAIEGESSRIKAETIKVEAYKADIDAYTALIKSKASETEVYAEQIKAEVAKAGIYETQVKAYASTVQAYATSADVQVKNAELENSFSKLSIDKYSADINKYIQSAQVEQASKQIQLESYRAAIDAYRADIALATADSELNLKVADNILQENKYRADVDLTNANFRLEALKAAYNANLESKKIAGNIKAQIAASSLSALNVSMQLQESYSNQSQNQYSESVSL